MRGAANEVALDREIVPRYDHGPWSPQNPSSMTRGPEFMWVQRIPPSSDLGRVLTPLSAGPTQGFCVGLVDLWVVVLCVPTSPEPIHTVAKVLVATICVGPGRREQPRTVDGAQAAEPRLLAWPWRHPGGWPPSSSSPRHGSHGHRDGELNAAAARELRLRAYCVRT